MSGGISAIKGFDYQATVILDRLFDHFKHHGPEAQARPEGIDDLDLSWTVGTVEHRCYVQIKKPTEDRDGNLNPSPWTLATAIGELFPNTNKQLSGNSYKQIWIVGDEVDVAVSSLVNAGKDAPIAATEPYWAAVHGLARNDALYVAKVEKPVRKKLLSWKIPSNLSTNPTVALSRIVIEFDNFAKSEGAPKDFTDLYSAKTAELHNFFPSILDRIEILPTYGTEQKIAQRVFDRLEKRYCLQRSIIENTLFRNLRGFIYDISKQPGRSFDQEELDVELRCVWPRMIPIKDAPPLDTEHIARPDLVERLTTLWAGKAVEAIGISGSGKTTLAAEAVKQSRIADPSRLVYYAEVRPDIGFHDVLAGVAFHLRRQGIHKPFSISVESSLAACLT